MDRRVSGRSRDRFDESAKDLIALRAEPEQVFDAAKIGVGAYSPLDGFMAREVLESVLARGRLSSGLPWPMPIVLSPPGKENAAAVERLKAGDEAALLDAHDRIFATIRIDEKFNLHRRDVALATYGTADPDHPNVEALARTGSVALAGPIRLLHDPPFPVPHAELTPAEARELFARKGWNSVAGYQTRNVPHSAHEHLQRLTLEREDVDGLFVHPVVGPLKAGDYRPDIVFESYQAVLRAYFPASRVALATLTIGMRYAGPRAALFLAIVRKNFGCTHYIVGRDQAGVGGYYDPYDCHRIFDAFLIGITPIRYRELAYCSRCGEMVSEKTCGHSPEIRVGASQTRVRTAIANRSSLPTEILRPEVAQMLRRPNVLLGSNDSILGSIREPGTPGWGPGADTTPERPRYLPGLIPMTSLVAKTAPEEPQPRRPRIQMERE